MSEHSAGQALRGVLAGLALAAAPTISWAASNSLWFARSWDSEEGLPNNTISGIAQTADGFLWLGTPNSLVRFDGLLFEDFSPTNFVAPPNRGTIVMLHGRDDALWLGLDRGGVVRLHGRDSRVFTDGLPNIIPNGLAEEATGALWVAYRGGPVYRIYEGKVSACGTKDGLPAGNDICALASDHKGRIWFAKAGRVGLVHEGVCETVHQFDEALPTRLAAARSGGVWLCLGVRLLKVEENGDARDLGQFRSEPGGTFATVMLEDHEGGVWIGTSYSGLFHHDQSGFETIPIISQEILSLAEDRERNLWVGTVGGGLSRLRRRAITLDGVETGLPFAAVQSLCQDSAGTLWAATQTGALARRGGDKWIALSAADGWPDDATCVAADPHGSLWIGTRLHGLYRWQDGRFNSWSFPGQIRGQTIHTVLVSRGGDLWIGEENPAAIQRLRGNQLDTFALPADSRIVRAMAEDAAGNIWAGTSKGVLVRVTGETLSEIRPRASEELASIRCLYATPDGSLWIGYAGWGIGRLKNGHYAEIQIEQGLHDNYVSHLVADQRGWLWFGANRGVFKVRLQDLDDVAEGHTRRVRSVHYGKSEGLPSLQGTFGDSPGALRTPDGRLWIPMRTGLVVVDPEKLGENLEPPPVLLSRVSLDDHPLAWYSGALPAAKSVGDPVLAPGGADAAFRLPPGHRLLEFEFAAPSLGAPENVQFRYRLEGLEQDWVEAGDKHTARYPRLPAGNYVFHVTACNRDGAWNKAGAILSLAVAPFLWQTWWFRTAALGLFTLVIIAIVRYVSFRRLHQRLQLLEQQAALHKERARIAKDIHDDLGANLTQIALLGELAQQDRGEPEKAGERSSTIAATARQAIKSLDEIVWAVNPRNDTLAHLLDYAGQFALDYLRLAGIRCRLDFPENAPSREVSTEIRHNLFLAIKEALNNIVKHAHATEVWLRATATDAALGIAIEDNGCGFDQPPKDAWADGLRNLRQRLAEIGGECRIESKTGAGTKLFFELPWPRK